MILVTTGTNGAPFDRLLRGVDGLDAREALVVQHGPSGVRPHGASCAAYLPFDVLVSCVRRARAVVTHAGAGSVVVALANGRRPFVVPRLARYGEAVDDHQVGFARRLADAGLVALVNEPERLPALLSEPEAEPADPELPGAGPLVYELAAYLQTVVAGARP